MNKTSLDFTLSLAAFAVAMAGLWIVDGGTAAGWLCVGGGAAASVVLPALLRPARRCMVSVMEGMLTLFVAGGFLCYAGRLGQAIGFNAYSALSLAAVMLALHELAVWWQAGRRRMFSSDGGGRHPWLLLQLVLAAVLMGVAAAYVAATRTDPVAMGYVAVCAAMFAGLLWLAFVARRLSVEARRELRVGLFDVVIVVLCCYGLAWLYGESWLTLTPVVFHALFLSVMLADVLRWAMEKDSRLKLPGSGGKDRASGSVGDMEKASSGVAS